MYSDVCDVEEIFAAERLYPVSWTSSKSILEDNSHFPDERHKTDECLSTNRAMKQKKKQIRPPKESKRKINNSTVRPMFEQSKLNLDNGQTFNYFSEPSQTTEVDVVSATLHGMPEEEWVAVDRQVRSVKLRLKVNEAAKECPKLIEQDENYVTLNFKKKPFAESNPCTVPRERSPNYVNYLIELVFLYSYCI